MRHDEEYDITQAFKKIEDELIASMIRNMDRHRAEEDDEGILWSQWQTEQLKSLEKYKVRNQKKYSKQFQSLNKRVEELVKIAHETGNMEQEIEILEAIKSGFTGYERISGSLQGEFFKLNERKLEALIEATTNDMKKAETAILRMANDKYRKIIFNAQVYANTGAGTYEKAVDMATKDMLAAGLNCVEYVNGARHTLADYVDMAIRTASKRAYLQGEGQKRQEWGISTVIMNKRGNPCPKCLPFCGKVLIDDVWSGGSRKDGDYPLMSYAISKGLYHPRCKDSHTTYFPGISTADDTWTTEELETVGQNAKSEAKQQYAKRQAERFGRLAEYSLDEENHQKYETRQHQWEKQRSGKRVIRKHKASVEKQEEKPTNKNGQEIVFDLINTKNQERAEAGKRLITQLSSEYDTYLVSVGTGAKNGAGSVDIDGSMLLNNYKPENVIHEFAHGLASSERVKFGLADENETAFMKELTQIRTKYEAAYQGNPPKEISGNSAISISAYSHKSKDEFLAEAFTQAKMKQLGLKLPDEFGTDTTYSDQVLALVDKYFKKTPSVKNNMELEFSPRKTTKGDFGVDWEKIQSPEYRKSLEKLSGVPKVVDAIEVRTKWALNNHNGLKTEELYAVSLESGEEIASVLGQRIEFGVRRTSEFISKLNKADEAGRQILLIHNHPRGLPPSISDINALLKNKNASGITIGHNGSIYRYTKPKKEIPEEDFKVALMKYSRYTEITGFEKALEDLSKEYGFEFERL